MFTMRSGPKLLDLPPLVLEQVCGHLPYHDKVALFYSSKQLLHLGCTSPQCQEQLATLEFDHDDDLVDPIHLACWLRSGRVPVRHLKLVSRGKYEPDLTPMPLLGTLAGSPLVSLVLDLSETFCNVNVNSWVRTFPQLRHLEVHSHFKISVHSSLTRLTRLTSLAVLINKPGYPECLDMDDDCLPASLRKLHIQGYMEVPEAVAQATQLEQLYLHLYPDKLEEVSRLGSLTNLTALRLSGELTELPRELTLLQKLQILDLWGNRLCFTGTPREVKRLSGVLSRLAHLESLYLHNSMDHNGRIHGRINGRLLALPSLKVLSLAETPLASLPAFAYPLLERLELDVELATSITEDGQGCKVPVCDQISLLTSLQELRLVGQHKADSKPKARAKQLAKLWAALARMGSLQVVWMCRHTAMALKGRAKKLPPPAWQRQLGKVRLVVGEDAGGRCSNACNAHYDSRGFQHDFATAWDAVE